EKALVERYAGQDFAIFGVNTDDSKEEYLKKCKEHGVTWKSIFGGGAGPGTAAADWGVEYYPTSYLLDANGVIRYKDLRGEQLEEKVAELMAELNSNE
ncbi:MAG: TlpA family protein disulfide reductase, partial [Planctomycetes bacterium]|nr:TlpA family protein disulfide reductase [Planctomycetota bacterium]